MHRLDPQSPGALFLRLLGRIETSLAKAKRPRAFKDEDIANGLRDQLFALEGWAKLHRHWPEKKERKVFEHLRSQVKTLEDALGFLDVSKEIAADLRLKKQTEAAKKFDEQADFARHKLKHILKEHDWFGDRVGKMRTSLEAIDWPSTAKQNDIMIEAMIADLNHLMLRYREELKPKLVKDVFDRKVVENDLHKLRRQLRWISMYFATANGLIALGPVGTHLTTEKKKLIAEYGTNEFAQLPKKLKPVAQIDAVAFFELTRLIAILGSVKDQAERYFLVRDVLKDETKARSLYGDAPHETSQKTQPILAEYERMKPLSYLVQSLQERR